MLSVNSSALRALIPVAAPRNINSEACRGRGGCRGVEVCDTSPHPSAIEIHFAAREETARDVRSLRGRWQACDRRFPIKSKRCK